LQVIDKDGKTLATSGYPYDGFSTGGDPLLLPYAGTIRFQISSQGMFYPTNNDKFIIDMGPLKSWIVPKAGAYFLSGTFSIAKEKGATTPHFDWSGTITFPKVEIPTAK